MKKATGLTSKELNRLYPDVYTHSYSLPSAHFNQWNLEKDKDNPEVYISKPQQESNRMGSEAEQRVLCSFQSLFENSTAVDNPNIRPMFVLSDIHFENVLKERAPKPPRKKESKCPDGAPQAEDPASFKKIKGETDLVVIQKQLGLTLVEVKKTESAHLTEVLQKLCNATGAQNNLKTFADELIKDLDVNVPVSFIFAFPNVTREDLETAAATVPKFVQLLRALNGRRIAPSDDGLLHVRCLCREEFPPQHQYLDPEQQDLSLGRLRQWWTQFASTVPRRSTMRKADYEKLVAAFVGPYTEITVWSQKDKRMTSEGRCVRTAGDVVHEIGGRFQRYVLAPQQVEVYKYCRRRCVYLTGPPGSGKTLLLTLKAAQWLSEGRYIIIVSSDVDNSVAQPVSLETEEKIINNAKLLLQARQDIGIVTQSSENVTQPTQHVTQSLNQMVRVFPCVGTKAPYTVVEEIRRLLAGRAVDKVTFIMDEVVDDKFRSLAAKLCSAFPEAFVWTAGPWPRDKPFGFRKMELNQCLRCPPVIQQILKDTETDCREKHSYHDSYVTSSTCKECPLPSDGTPVEWLSHQGQGHTQHLCDCRTCGLQLAQYLMRELNVGDDERLKFSDVLIVTQCTSLKKTKFLKAMKDVGMRIRAVESGSGKENDVAFPGDMAIAADISLVAGLERMVVVHVPETLILGKKNPSASNKKKEPQPSTTHRRLWALGEDNRKALWYVLSRSLSHGVLFHFGEEDVMETEADVREDDSDENEDRQNGPEEEVSHETMWSSWIMKICFVVALLAVLIGYICFPLSYAPGLPQRTVRRYRQSARRTRHAP